MKIFGILFKFGNPKPVDIVIYDECNSRFAKETLPKGLTSAIFKIRQPDIWVSIDIFFNLLKCIKHFSLKNSFGNRNYLVNILIQFRNIYFEAFLITIGPKAVITFIDNSSSFHWLSKNCRSFPCIAIQNGARLRYQIKEQGAFYFQHYFSWGMHELDLFNELGFQVENLYPVGSLVAGLHWNNSEIIEDFVYDILIVSTWRGNIGTSQDVIDTMRSMETMDHLVAKYLQRRKLKAAIIFRAERQSEHWVVPGYGSEYDYFKNIYKGFAEFIEADFNKRTIYPLMQKSELVISCLSSALTEAYGYGKKVLYCNYTGKDDYHCDINQKIVTTEKNEENFFNLLDGLLSQSEMSYSKEHCGNRKYVMDIPSNHQTHEAIRNELENILSLTKI